jgi:hypothetical protein
LPTSSPMKNISSWGPRLLLLAKVGRHPLKAEGETVKFDNLEHGNFVVVCRPDFIEE